METFDDLKLERYINKALLEKSFGRTELYMIRFWRLQRRNKAYM